MNQGPRLLPFCGALPMASEVSEAGQKAHMEKAQLLNALAASDIHMTSSTFHWLKLVTEPLLTANGLESGIFL